MKSIEANIKFLTAILKSMGFNKKEREEIFNYLNYKLEQKIAKK